MDTRKTYLTVLILLAVFAVQAFTSIWPDRKSPTADELAHHIPVGYVLIEKGDLKMDPSQPPLARYMAALPLKLFMDLNIPDERSQWRREDRSEFGKDFFYKYNDQPHRMILYSRLIFIAAGVLCGFILFLMARSFYGERAALLSLFLYAFSPNILAHTRLATIDMTFSFFLLLSVYTFWLFLKNGSPGHVFSAGLCLGLAQFSKYAALLLYPIFALLVLAELPGASRSGERVKLILKFLAIVVISILVLWACYGFEAAPLLKDAMRIQEKLSIARSIAGKALPFWNEEYQTGLADFLRKAPFPLGAHTLGILGVMRHGFQGHSVYFMGNWLRSGNPLYFVVAFLIKTPIPSMIFILTGFILALMKGLRRNERFLLITAGVIFLVASFSNLQLGIRYILPVYPLCFILAGRCADLWDGKKVYRIVGILLMAWYMVSAIWIWPNYLSYFNETIGGPDNGYKYLRDSNIDWGQDLPALAAYMRENDIEKVKLLYFGTASPESYGIRYDTLSEREKTEPGKDVYAISIHASSRAKWAEDNKPVAKAGYSIFIYDFREGEK